MRAPQELIKVRGFQVAPAELEGHLLGHPRVADACVVGVPDEYSGELPMAFVVLKADPAAAGTTTTTINTTLTHTLSPPYAHCASASQNYFLHRRQLVARTSRSKPVGRRKITPYIRNSLTLTLARRREEIRPFCQNGLRRRQQEARLHR